MSASFEIISPIDGDMLHTADIVMEHSQPRYRVCVSAPATAVITVNGQSTTSTAGMFTVNIPLPQYKNKIEVTETGSRETSSITVYRINSFAGKYRVSIDDNIWFLQDIHRNENQYRSIFDNPFLGFLKKLNTTHGTKVHLNLFYQTAGFNLSQLSDKFKSEWTAQAHWIRLSFHALQEFPDMPYKNASYEQVQRDCEKVVKEIHRFAGAALTGPVTTLHWGEANVDGSRALRDAGYKGQLGYFNVDDDLPAVSYYLTVEQRRHLKKRFIWKDPAEDIIFIRSSIVLDRTKLADIIPFLDQYQQTAEKPPYADFLIHEQYFYPFYQAYQPDYCDKIEAAVHWAVTNNYTPAFLGNCIFE